MPGRHPVIAAGAVDGPGLEGVALVDRHYALQYVGILGAQLREPVNGIHSCNAQPQPSHTRATYEHA